MPKDDIKKAKILAQQIIDEFAMANEYFSSSTQVETLLHDATLEVRISPIQIGDGSIKS